MNCANIQAKYNMQDTKLFDTEERFSPVELIYDADRSLMPAKDLGEAIVGMSIALKIAGRVSLLDFEDVFIYPVQEGSVKSYFVYIKKNKNLIITQINIIVVSQVLISSLNLIGHFGLSAFKNPSTEVISGIDKKVLSLCMNADFRKSIVKIAKPINEINQKVTIKIINKSYEITCDNQYKFLLEEDDPILPELKNGEEVSLVGKLTRMNMVPNNDLGFDYKGRILSLTPRDEDKNVATEYHQFTPLPRVVVSGIVVRKSDFEVPRIKVISMNEVNNNQINIFGSEKK
jgi:hypothetical protein